jgi:outer membrane protein OmpA-like peptidoglycan-associated protein
MSNMARFAPLFLLIVLVSGCAKKTLVALVPDPDGKTGSITVNNESGSVAINAPYEATSMGDAGDRPTAPEHLGKESLDRIFAEALSIQPKRPLHFLLYFDKETTLTSDSTKLLPGIITVIRERNSNYISVIGHTDTVGSKDYNTALSSSRAKAVKELLVSQGTDPNAIQTTSHGKENLLIPTGDNVNEPRNRRVEVVVR